MALIHALGGAAEGFDRAAPHLWQMVSDDRRARIEAEAQAKWEALKQENAMARLDAEKAADLELLDAKTSADRELLGARLEADKEIEGIRQGGQARLQRSRLDAEESARVAKDRAARVSQATSETMDVLKKFGAELPAVSEDDPRLTSYRHWREKIYAPPVDELGNAGNPETGEAIMARFRAYRENEVRSLQVEEAMSGLSSSLPQGRRAGAGRGGVSSLAGARPARSALHRVSRRRRSFAASGRRRPDAEGFGGDPSGRPSRERSLGGSPDGHSSRTLPRRQSPMGGTGR